MKKIVVPEAMLMAAMPFCDNQMHSALEAALRWLSENPIVPTDEQARELSLVWGEGAKVSWYKSIENVVIVWQRRMFLAPEPEVPEIADLVKDFRRDGDAYNAVIEAYRRGQKSKG